MVDPACNVLEKTDLIDPLQSTNAPNHRHERVYLQSPEGLRF